MTTSNPKISALIVAGGTGERFGSARPKQYLPLLGKPVLCWSLEVFQQHPLISDVLVVINPLHTELLQHAAPQAKFVIGGSSRQDSVRLGLAALKSSPPDFVLIHDAARPLISADTITALCEAAISGTSAIPAIAVTDTVRRKENNMTRTENREGLYTVQTPQAFSYNLVTSLHEKYIDAAFTDDAALCEAEGYPVQLVTGQPDNIKITHAGDIARAEQFLFARCGDVRTGQGYDVHRLVPPASPDRKLYLCGIAIPHDMVLEGHSDADVGLHAITDAVLAAICNADIGRHFSPKDDRWKGADSSRFLRHAADLVTKQGGLITHVDVTLICEAPKIDPHREAMRARIAEILCLPLNRISVKATTTEGLGFTGRREGIAAQSVVTVRLPFGRDEP